MKINYYITSKKPAFIWVDHYKHSIDFFDSEIDFDFAIKNTIGLWRIKYKNQ